MGSIKLLLLNLPSFSNRLYCREIMGGFGLEVGRSLRYPPLPLAYTAALCERDSIPVDLKDAEALEWSEHEILSHVETGGFDLLGIISSLITLKSDLAFIDRMKQRLPRVMVFLTGPIIYLYKDDILSRSTCDFTINTLNDDKPLELVRALEADDLSGLKGVSYRDGERVIHLPDEDRMIEMSTLPIPARRFLPNDRYFIAGMKGPMTTVQTARGCPFRCEICTYKFSQGHLYRTRDLDRVMEEIREIVGRYGIRNIVFRDITFTVNRKRILELCDRLIEADLGLTWWAETTLNLVDEELLTRMRDAGMDALSMGVETGGAEQQEAHWAQKTFSLEKTRDIFNTCHGLGIKTRAYFVMGFPGETRKSYRETIRWARALRPTTLQFLPFRDLPCKIEAYTQVDPELLGRIKKAYLTYYLTPSNLMRQFLQPRLFWNRIRRFCNLRRE
ncbi:MAG: B12-binding domain-containing radical SAM protein [Planctomycetes bacterium]|nr:B12-binding domain-containing radical SAM protein [Planctomycetota bacterium]